MKRKPDNPYMSHQPILAACMLRTAKKPVLELGCGWGSTPLLHGLCAARKQDLLTLERLKEWKEKFLYLEREWHQFYDVDSWYNVSNIYDKIEFGLAFIDHNDALARGHSLKMLADCADLIVCHDRICNCRYDFSKFKYVYHYTDVYPHTHVASNVTPLNFLERI